METNNDELTHMKGSISLPEGFVSVLDSLAEAVIVFDSEGIAEQANLAIRTALGFDPTGLDLSAIGEKSSFRAYEGDRASLRDLVSSTGLAGNPVTDVSMTYSDGNGKEKKVLCTVTPLIGEGQVSGAVFAFHERHDEAKRDANARKERNRLLRILDSIEDGIYICNGSFHVEYANPALVSKFGDPTGKRCYDYLYKRNSRCPWCRGEEVFNGKTVHWEWRNPDTGRVYDIVDTPLRNPDGSVSKLKLFHDVTERKEAEQTLIASTHRLESEVEKMNEELAQSNILLREQLEDLHEKDRQLRSQSEVLEKIFLNTHLLIAFLGPGFDFIRVNKAWSDTDGRPALFFQGKNYFTIYPDEEQKRIFCETSKSGLPFIGYETPFAFTGKSERGVTYWDWSLQPVKSEPDATDGLILILIDVTEKTEAGKELMKAQVALAEAKRLSDIGTLAATVAHELRNPLGVIQAAIYNIKRKTKEENIASHIANIENKLGESERIIANLLNYSNIKQPKLKKIHLYNFIDECLVTIAEQYRDYPVAINKNIEGFRDIVISLDPFQIREVLMNLLHNAYQALPEKGGTIDVGGTILPGDSVSISISDDGEGIDPEDMKKIFTPFFTRKSKGTGLGLTICEELVKLHNGTIDLRSVKEKGTTVRIMLPLSDRQ